MTYKTIEILVENKYQKDIDKLINKKEIINTWKIKNNNDYYKYSLVVEEKNVEMIVDILSNIFGFDKEVDNVKNINDTIAILPIEGFLPKIRSAEKEEILHGRNEKTVDRVSTEEMYDSIMNDAKLSQNFLLNVVLSTIICSIGIIKRDVATLVAASAIAPFLGAILGYSFSISTDDYTLMKKSIKTLSIGLLISISIGVIMGQIWDYLPYNYTIEINQGFFRQIKYSYYAFALALASGASAGLAVTAGTPIVMASFMVAVALLPNITITGIAIGMGFFELFLNSFLLLCINILCIVLTSQLIFAFKKIKPKNKKDYSIRNMIFYVVAICILVWLKYLFVNS